MRNQNSRSVYVEPLSARILFAGQWNIGSNAGSYTSDDSSSVVIIGYDEQLGMYANDGGVLVSTTESWSGRLQINLKGGDDTLIMDEPYAPLFASQSVRVYGGEGNDTLIGSSASEEPEKGSLLNTKFSIITFSYG